MIPIARDVPLTRQVRVAGFPRLGTQPIALAAVTLLVVLAAVATIALSRAYTATAPETDRAVAARRLQARTAQASEQLVEKTKGLEATQQESIDQLQMVQDQLQTMRHMLAAQQADAKRLSEQVQSLTEAVEGLRQSFASAQPSESPTPPAAHDRTGRARANAAVRQTARVTEQANQRVKSRNSPD